MFCVLCSTSDKNRWNSSIKENSKGWKLLSELGGSSVLHQGPVNSCKGYIGVFWTGKNGIIVQICRSSSHARDLCLWSASHTVLTLHANALWIEASSDVNLMLLTSEQGCCNHIPIHILPYILQKQLYSFFYAPHDIWKLLSIN